MLMSRRFLGSFLIELNNSSSSDQVDYNDIYLVFHNPAL